MEFKSGYAAIVGLPNAGKSSLLNALLGQKLSIATNKPQTTRKSIAGILTEEDYQIVFLDTPGILKPEYLMQERMMEFVIASVKDADVILFLVDLEKDPTTENLLENEYVKEVLSTNEQPKILLLNKADKSDDKKIKELVTSLEAKNIFKSIFPVSSLYKFNVDSVKSAILDYLPVHPKYYDEDIVSNETERFFVTEIIREKIFENYQDEIPYSCEVLIEEFKERKHAKDFVSADIIVERNSQKGIIIGKDGDAIKRLGTKARKDIETFLEREVFLELRVKVKEKWRNDANALRLYGYSKPSEE